MPHAKNHRDARRAAVEPLLTLLSERWPRCFELDPRRRKPLAVGIRAEIERQLPEVDPGLLRKALSFYAASIGYQRASMIPGTVRVALDGSASGTITTEQAKRAILTVAALTEKQQSRPVARPVSVAESAETGTASKPRMGLRDLREAGRRRGARP